MKALRILALIALGVSCHLDKLVNGAGSPASPPSHGTPVGLEAGAAGSGEWRMGTVSRVNHIDNQVILTDGTVVKVTPSTVVHRGAETLPFDKLQPGWEIVVKGPKAPVVDAAQIDVVWAPTGANQ